MIHLSDEQLIKVLTPEIREQLTAIWMKARKAAQIKSLEDSIVRQQIKLDTLKAVKPAEEKP